MAGLALALLPRYPRPIVNYHEQLQAFTLGSPGPASGDLGEALNLPSNLQAELTGAQTGLSLG